ncbi:Transcriptional regulator ure2 [Paraconiothyrium brasiliense]|uniref:Transcriptional regulator ure2 n=1 Tax=Paraconiothyrium brasiliense TaxID=300254 RepID=A0ABR3QW03_9PLEO
MTSVKPIKIWSTDGPNPLKVAMVAAELNLHHEIIHIGFDKAKDPEYLAINPNGRLPAIYDPNTDLTLWESGAIIEYLVENYDHDHKLSHAIGTPSAYHSKQWLYFQASGQGPYYGQAVWFKKYHPEHLPSALHRYVAEMKRVTSVLEGHLKKQRARYRSEPWLAGDRMTYADIAFIPYQLVVPKILNQELKPYDLEQFTEVSGWMNRLTGREAIKKVLPTT